jgi:glycogen debranching enzyme
MSPDSVIVSSGERLVYGQPTGDLAPGTFDGFYASDTRFLSGLELRLAGERPAHLGASVLDPTIVSFYGQLGGAAEGPGPRLAVVRDRYVASAWHEDISVLNLGQEPLDTALLLTLAADFADVFEVRGARRQTGATAEVGTRPGYPLVFEYAHERFRAATYVATSEASRARGSALEFTCRVPAKSYWKTCVEFLPVLGEQVPEVACVSQFLDPPFAPFRRSSRAKPLAAARHRPPPIFPDPPELETDLPALRAAYAGALRDFDRLTIEPVAGLPVLAAGLPWYMAVFGRDLLITALETRLLGPSLMVNALRLFRGLQAHATDPFRRAAPGKIPHEVRHGELSVSGAVPHTRYFGSVDSTPLYVLLFTETVTWTADRGLAAKLLPSVEEALRWCDAQGETDGDGFLLYTPDAPPGLRNQGWKDSEDAIAFADGALAEGPIAVAEAQAYLYAAKRGMVRVYRDLGRDGEADRLEVAAHRLKVRFNDRFWIPSRGYYAMALDGEKRPVDGLGSNIGHALYCGLVDDGRAAQVAERLLSEEMYSGWGLRTLSTEMARYHPESYHNGSVWPHDTMLFALGLARYGFSAEAREVAVDLLDAVAASESKRPPELFAGFSRRDHEPPVPYPAANAPQAWASGAVIAAMEILGGVHEMGGRLLVGAQEEGPRVHLRGIRFRGRRWRV